jgi:hypothetical protein
MRSRLGCGNFYWATAGRRHRHRARPQFFEEFEREVDPIRASLRAVGRHMTTCNTNTAEFMPAEVAVWREIEMQLEPGKPGAAREWETRY